MRGSGIEYLDAVIDQLTKWHNGVKEHNRVTGECCPDFSCCDPGLYCENEEKRRDKLQRAVKARREATYRGTESP